MDADTLYEVAVRALSRRARSSAEIRLLLEKRKARTREIEIVLRRLRENGYLDDARFAHSFASTRLENELQGRARVRRDLHRRGVKPEVIQQAIGRAYQEVDESQLLRRYIQRKARPPQPLARPAAVVALYRRLLRAGFASDTIVRELKRMLRGPHAKGGAATDSEAWDELLDSLSEISTPEPVPSEAEGAET